MKSKTKPKAKTKTKAEPENPAEALKSLGRSVAAVATTLHELGIRGYADDERSCPVARFLAREGWWAEVTQANITCHRRLGKDGGIMLFHLRPSAQIRKFIEQFDEGAYPELEEKL